MCKMIYVFDRIVYNYNLSLKSKLIMSIFYAEVELLSVEHDQWEIEMTMLKLMLLLQCCKMIYVLIVL